MRTPPSGPAAQAGGEPRSRHQWSGSGERPPGGERAGADIGAERFRQVMGRHPAGVVVVTAAPDQGPVGLTATSFTSVSLEPPLVSFYIDGRASSWPGIRDAQAFAVNLLAEDQHGVAARFASRGVDRFAPPTRWWHGPAGVPLLHGASGHVVCRRHDVLAVGDHWLVVGRVAATAVAGEQHVLGVQSAPDAAPGSSPGPLLYHRGRYGSFTARED
ncbi:flavin reductase family protein [Nocardiopsis sp. CNT-189]|uniref:flavin reductase family protein n=1 Tax=Nocardiopsis oceanisediminis TaxID=2816862 RepID=UPI003B31CA90